MLVFLFVGVVTTVVFGSIAVASYMADHTFPFMVAIGFTLMGIALIVISLIGQYG